MVNLYSHFKSQCYFLQDHEDELKWIWNKTTCTLFAKLGYEAMIAQYIIGDRIKW